MSAPSCARVRRWLVAGEAVPAPPGPELAAHVAGCAHCRGALAAIFAQLLGRPPRPAGCDACAEDLPAFVEAEAELGAAAAARLFPELWWHLWTCPDCAEAAAAIAAMVAAEARGLIPPPPTSPTPSAALWPLAGLPALPPISLDRALLHAVFVPQLQLGATWGGGADAQFLAEHELPGCRVTIAVRQSDDGHCELEVAVEPPVAGTVVVRFGALRYSGALVDGLRATIGALPLALFTDRDGPDMLLSIERPPGAADGP